MRLLLDTQALIWYVDQDQLLSRAAHAAITDQSSLLWNSEEPMAQKSKAKRVAAIPVFQPQSFTRAELLKAIKEVKAERLRRGKRKSVS